MNNLLTYSMIVLLAPMSVLAQVPDTAALEAQEKTVWQVVKDKKIDQFKNFLSDKVMAVYSDGIYNKDQEIASVAKIDMKSFALSDFTVTMPDPNTAVLTYKCKVEGTADGKDTSGAYNCGTIWQMKNGKSQAIFHSDIKAEGAAGAAEKKE
jgi:hypothetical protein